MRWEINKFVIADGAQNVLAFHRWFCRWSRQDCTESDVNYVTRRILWYNNSPLWTSHICAYLGTYSFRLRNRRIWQWIRLFSDLFSRVEKNKSPTNSITCGMRIRVFSNINACVQCLTKQYTCVVPMEINNPEAYMCRQVNSIWIR